MAAERLQVRTDPRTAVGAHFIGELREIARGLRDRKFRGPEPGRFELHAAALAHARFLRGRGLLRPFGCHAPAVPLPARRAKLDKMPHADRPDVDRGVGVWGPMRATSLRARLSGL